MNAVIALVDGTAMESAPSLPMQRLYTPEIARALEHRGSSERLKRWLLEAVDSGEVEDVLAEIQELAELLERYLERINVASEALGLDVEELLRGVR